MDCKLRQLDFSTGYKFGVIDQDPSIVGDYYIKTWSNATIESRVMVSAADYDLDGDIDLIFPGAGEIGTTTVYSLGPYRQLS